MEWAKEAERQHGVVTTAQLTAGGEDPSALSRSGRIERVTIGIYRVVGSVPTWRQWLWAAVLAAGPGSAVSGRAAAALWRIPGFGPGPVEVTTTNRGGRDRRYGVLRRVRFLPSELIRPADGIPALEPAAVVLDLCGSERPERAERALDNLLAAGAVSVARLQLVLALLGRRGKQGTTVLRDLVAVRVGDFVAPESELEAVFLGLVALWGFPPPQRQVVLGGEEVIGRVDFVYPELRLVIELDGRRWHDSHLDWQGDHRRQARLQAAGWTVLRFTWHQLTDEPDLVLAVLARFFDADGENPRQNVGWGERLRPG